MLFINLGRMKCPNKNKTRIKPNPESNPFTTCVLGCGIPTGWGAVMNNPNFHANSSVAVWGLVAVGLAVI